MILFGITLIVAREEVLPKPRFDRKRYLEEYDLSVTEEDYNSQLLDDSRPDLRDQSHYKTINQDYKSKNKSYVEKAKSHCVSYFRSIHEIPRELVILCVISVFGWLSHNSFLFFFSDFVGVIVFNGSADAPHNSTRLHNYNEGVRVAGLAFIGATIVDICYAFLLERCLLERIGWSIIVYSTKHVCLYNIHL